ncbi:DNA-directed RNA polymerase subunit alpha [Candidatus Aerophobetes bacterium Ae_b3b]|nr:MAG: DNA-directed RNA polymerase subunit alpha [Candidatus Aerophobetes bacterium Ae_b3b]
MRQLIKPKEVVIERETFSDTYGRFIIEPLERGYGITLGNSLRRILLSSISGAAVRAVKIEGVSHEFSTISGVKEDVLQIIQNLKRIRVKLFVDGEKKVFLDVRGPLEMKASHIKADSEVEIVNPDLYLATLDNKETHLTMEITLAKGRGYATMDESRDSDQPLGTIPMDSIFSPVKRVKCEVKPARIGRKTSFDSLIVEIFTDGTVKPDDAVGEAARILTEYLGFFMAEPPKGKKAESEKKLLEQSVEELGLSAVPVKALRSSGIKKIGDLVEKSSKELLKIQNFGEKSLQKLEKKLAECGLSLSEGEISEAQEKAEKAGTR